MSAWVDSRWYVRVSLANTEAVVIGLDDLIEMKRAVGRPRDRDDVIHLEALARLDDDQGLDGP